MKNQKSEIKNRLLWVSIYAIAMGFLEAVVVIYLRELFYPNGFEFPLKEMPLPLVKVEVLREAATILMLVAIAMIATKNKWQRWGFFLISFAVWDIIYYVGLKWFYNWPESLFTWDVLFLIPVTWVGPVVTPILIALLMIVIGVYLVLGNEKERNLPLQKVEIWSLALGAFICILAFTQDYTKQLIETHQGISIEAILTLSETYIPQTFNWLLFGSGFLMICYGVAHYIFHFYKKQKKDA